MCRRRLAEMRGYRRRREWIVEEANIDVGINENRGSSRPHTKYRKQHNEGQQIKKYTPDLTRSFPREPFEILIHGRLLLPIPY